MTPETWDSMIPHFLQNVSPAGRELLYRAIQPAQPTSQFFSIDAGELEGWTLRFLASFADTPNWENTISLVNEHHQTLAHLAVLFRYTTLLKQVAQWGIDVDVQDVNGFTALHCAYLCGDLDSVGVLKGYGADEDIEDNLGRRPLDIYTPSTNDLSRGSPSSDRTSSSSQRTTSGEEDWENVSIASSQPGSNSFFKDDWELRKGVGGRNLSDSSISLENTPSFSRNSEVSVATSRYVRSKEQELKRLHKTSNKSNWQCNQNIQSRSLLREANSKPRRYSRSEGGDRDSPGEYDRSKNDLIGSTYIIKSVSADPFT